MAKSAAGPKIVLADAGAVGVVLEQCGHAEALADDARQRHVVPAGQVRGIGDHAFCRLDGAGCGDAGRAELGDFELRVARGIEHRLANAVDDGIGALGCERRDAIASEHAARRVGDDFVRGIPKSGSEGRGGCAAARTEWNRHSSSPAIITRWLPAASGIGCAHL